MYAAAPAPGIKAGAVDGNERWQIDECVNQSLVGDNAVQMVDSLFH